MKDIDKQLDEMFANMSQWEDSQELKQAIKQLINQARIDELEHLELDIGLFPMSYGKDDDKWQERQRNIAKIEKRIAELKGE